MPIEVRSVDYSNPQQAEQFLFLLNHYSCDSMGGGEPLPDHVMATLVDEVQKRPFFNSAIAYVDDQPAALVNYAEGFSSFAAKPLLNVHDLVVHADFRGKGLSHRLLEFVENEAQALGCCKLTLEVLAENEIAKSSYKKYGFAPYQLTEAGGAAEFWQKKLG